MSRIITQGSCINSYYTEILWRKDLIDLSDVNNISKIVEEIGRGLYVYVDPGTCCTRKWHFRHLSRFYLSFRLGVHSMDTTKKYLCYSLCAAGLRIYIQYINPINVNYKYFSRIKIFMTDTQISKREYKMLALRPL